MSLEEQIMSKDKYPSIFSPQMKAIVFIILQIFFATRVGLKIGEYSCFEKGCPTKPYATMPKGIMGNRGLWYLIEALGVSAT